MLQRGHACFIVSYTDALCKGAQKQLASLARLIRLSFWNISEWASSKLCPCMRAAGKTFIGAMVCDAIVRLSSETILCVCYTNHALDQFLESLLDKGITSIVRIGSRSKSARLERYNLSWMQSRANDGSGGRQARPALGKTEYRRIMTLRDQESRLKTKVGAGPRGAVASRQLDKRAIRDWASCIIALAAPIDVSECSPAYGVGPSARLLASCAMLQPPLAWWVRTWVRVPCVTHGSRSSHTCMPGCPTPSLPSLQLQGLLDSLLRTCGDSEGAEESYKARELWDPPTAGAGAGRASQQQAQQQQPQAQAQVQAQQRGPQRGQQAQPALPPPPPPPPPRPQLEMWDLMNGYLKEELPEVWQEITGAARNASIGFGWKLWLTGQSPEEVQKGGKGGQGEEWHQAKKPRKAAGGGKRYSYQFAEEMLLAAASGKQVFRHSGGGGPRVSVPGAALPGAAAAASGSGSDGAAASGASVWQLPVDERIRMAASWIMELRKE